MRNQQGDNRGGNWGRGGGRPQWRGFGYGGHRRGGGGGGGGRGGGAVPPGAPTGPASMQGHARGGRGGQQGTVQRGGREGDGGQGGDGQSTTSHAPSWTPSQKQLMAPSRYKQPTGNYIDQPYAGNVGTRDRWTDCFRCRKPRAPGHPDFEHCGQDCGFCYSNSHPGQLCPMLWCTERWWKDHFGYVPDHVQIRPSESQRQRLAEVDPHFAHFPQPLPVGAPAKRGREDDEEDWPTKKRVARPDDAEMEVEQAKWAAERRVLESRLDKSKAEVVELAKAKRLAENKAGELDEDNATMSLEVSRQRRKYAELERSKTEGIRSQAEAIERREQAKYESRLREVQEQHELEKQKAIELAVKEAVNVTTAHMQENFARLQESSARLAEAASSHLADLQQVATTTIQAAQQTQMVVGQGSRAAAHNDEGELDLIHSPTLPAPGNDTHTDVCDVDREERK